jgi:hypothetical protein
VKQQIVVNQLRLHKNDRKVQYELKSQNASFVKYIGFTENANLMFVQDSAFTNYYFSATGLTLVKEIAAQAKVVDVCGTSEYILQAIENKKVVIINRATFQLIRTIGTKE